MKRNQEKPSDFTIASEVNDANDSALASRTYNIPTSFSDYLVRFRTPEFARKILPVLASLEPQANELWQRSDTLEVEDFLQYLHENPPSPELIAMVMLTGKSKLKIKAASGKGGKAKKTAMHEAKAAAINAWQADSSKRSAKKFADDWAYERREQNKKNDIEDKARLEQPESDTVRQWLKGIKKNVRVR